MNRYALNSAVLTAFGSYEYEPLNRTAAREWWEAGPVEATIGYEETCIAMERVLSISRPCVNRKTIEMDPGDEALVFRIALPYVERRLATRGDVGIEEITPSTADEVVGRYPGPIRALTREGRGIGNRPGR